VHNIHYNKNDQISQHKLHLKMNTILNSEELNITYSGRMSEMKGPIEWLTALNILKKHNVRFKAKWFGEGELKNDMLKHIKEFNLENSVELMGFVSDKNIVKEALQTSDIFMFCHKTQESPRNLIEALKSGCPIIGFESNYSNDLINKNEGGILVKDYCCDTLADKIINLYNDRHSLSFLMKKAYDDGLLYSDDIVFQHRSELIKKYLN
jgi:glycosyltransferase involved in cell wall biosynthesis